MARMTSRKEAVLKPRTCCLEAAEDVAICADPVPVRRPGVRGTALELADWVGDAQTGKIKSGLYLTVSQRTSTHDAQLETMISPEVGVHFSVPATSTRLTFRAVM